MLRRFFTIAVLAAGCWVAACGQATDKADADKLLYEELSAAHEVENWHPELIVLADRLAETAERGVYVLRGDTFQIGTLRSDIYLRRVRNDWKPIYDNRYPVESLTNLLMNQVRDNRHQLTLHHHQYGGAVPTIVMPMQTLFDVLGRHTDSYCSVTAINAEEIRAVLVFHQRRFNYIHMLDLRLPTKQLFEPEGMLTAELYTNIPQNNVLNIFTERKN